MKKKFFLISANQLQVPYPVYPVGLSYIATYLAPRLPNIDIRILDRNLTEPEQLLALIKAEQPAYVGFSMRNVDDGNSYEQLFFVEQYKKLIQSVRQITSCPIILGGAGYSIYPELLFKELQPDYGIYGEGEATLLELIEALENKKDPTGIKSLVYQKHGAITINPRAAYLRDLDLKYDPGIIDFYWRHSGMLSLQTKRGCPYNCIYCTYPLIEGKSVRTLNPDKIIAVLKELKQSRGIDYVYFTDSVFNIDHDYNVALAQKIIDSNIGIHWGAFFAPKDLDRKTLSLYKGSGLTHIEFGTESLSDSVLKSYGKSFTMDDVFRSAQLTNELKIFSAHFLILGGYGETQKTYQETLMNCQKIDNSIFFPFIGMRIYPNTPLQQYAIKEGVITADDPLIKPTYYISKNVDLGTISTDVEKTGKAWVLPDQYQSEILNKLRKKGKAKGPMWEYLIK